MKLRPHLAHVIVLALAVTSSSLLVVGNPLFYSTAERTRPTKAALIDEVAATNPDPYLVSNVTRTLTRVGYSVDYYGLRDVTVGLFRNLPSKGYGVVILRDHSTSLTGDVIALVTSEPFDPGKYVNERLAGEIIPVPLDNSTYFGITPTFVRESIQGTFSNTLLVVMGCAGLANSEMAQAFVAKGVEVYISWNHIVLTNQSDGGAILLLQSMTRGHRIDEAAAWATENAPSNAAYPSELEYYPLDQGELMLNLAA